MYIIYILSRKRVGPELSTIVFVIVFSMTIFLLNGYQIYSVNNSVLRLLL